MCLPPRNTERRDIIAVGTHSNPFDIAYSIIYCITKDFPQPAYPLIPMLYMNVS